MEAVMLVAVPLSSLQGTDTVTCNSLQGGKEGGWTSSLLTLLSSPPLKIWGQNPHPHPLGCSLCGGPPMPCCSETYSPTHVSRQHIEESQAHDSSQSWSY